ncbi:nuclear transport factor 2 family protein [Haloarcula sp. CBA1130]|uniref:nuclear transport factor 2 family protein n=1 Tax=unclassified Haloarcula TaxID=2624677 RepID=UPI001244ECD7|nr:MULTISPECIES: nuclear transport factor 2 family protein [unclassified Haloarcula]KAA9399334.1 nuclear transport factor 2 family protein [Haloarcula sp. CBA1129]KAA9403848.1 nuclear transport factor 2 family protein [Haloarcula sp. CBA1130]
MTRPALLQRARTYYDALDGDDYDQLASLLAPSFVHDRPDQTIEGREGFVRFMREERPQTDTTHPLDGLYCRREDGTAEQTDGESTVAEVVARGRLLDADGERIVGFVDVFTFTGDDIERIETYTR